MCKRGALQSGPPLRTPPRGLRRMNRLQPRAQRIAIGGRGPMVGAGPPSWASPRPAPSESAPAARPTDCHWWSGPHGRGGPAFFGIPPRGLRRVNLVLGLYDRALVLGLEPGVCLHAKNMATATLPIAAASVI